MLKPRSNEWPESLLAPFRFRHIVRRNFLMWRKVVSFVIVGHIIEPLILLTGLGFGLGSFLPAIDGLSYATFLAAGVICTSVSDAATGEALQSVFIRWKVRRTWDSVLSTPMNPGDIVMGELIWAGIRATISGAAILLAVLLLGLVESVRAVWILPVLLLHGLAMSSTALIAVALVKSQELQMYYYALFLMPMTMISGVYFAADRLPQSVQMIAQLLPLYHSTALTRSLLVGGAMDNVAIHLCSVAAYAAIGACIAVLLINSRITR